MKQSLTNLDLSIIILIIFLMLLKSIYNLYIINIYSDKEDTYDDLEKIFERDTYSVFNIINFITASIFLFASIYFYMANKIKTILFAGFCLFMFWRALGYFTYSYVPIPNETQEVILYHNVTFVSLLMLFFSLYLLKLILIG